MPHQRYERVRKVDTHFPIHALLSAVRWNVDKPGMSRFPELHCPSIITKIPCDPAHAVKSIASTWSDNENTPRPDPIQTFIKGIARPSVHSISCQSLTLPGGVHFTLLFREAAYPAGSPVIVSAGRASYEPDRRLHCEESVLFFLGLMIEFKKVADRKSVSHKYALETSSQGNVRSV